MPKIVYILTNPAMEGLIKIGFTDGTLEKRMKEIDKTGVPLPFQCYYAGEVDNNQAIEKLMHKAFEDKRVRKEREFFRMNPEQAKSALMIANPKDVTPQKDIFFEKGDAEAVKRANSENERRSRLKLSHLNISIGTVLTFIKDENITCLVASDTTVFYDGITTSLTDAALKALKKLGTDWSSVQGGAYWLYEGETLLERRLRLEKESE